MNSQWSKVSLIFFLIVAIIGSSLRATQYFELPFAYSNLVHAHSHTAFQGWIYTIIFLLITRLYVSEEGIKQGKYPLQFKLTILILVGVLISFSLQGYGLYSIIASTLFQLLNYWFIYRFFRDSKTSSDSKITSLTFIKAGLWLGILSTLIPYGIGILSAKGLGHSEAYNSLVYTFLHLQYNGWFLFIALGLLYKFMEDQQISFCPKQSRWFYVLLSISVIPAICLSLLGMSFAPNIQLLAYIAAALQIVALFFFVKSFNGQLRMVFKNQHWLLQLPLLLFISSFLLKIIIQSLSILPALESLAFHNKPMILAYLHLNFIGMLSFLFIAWMIQLSWIGVNMFSKIGCTTLIAGYLVTEIMLVLDGLRIFYSSGILLLGSLLMSLGILLLAISKKGKALL